MSLTRRQRNIVDQILQEQLGAITQARRESEKLLDQSLLNEEYELDEAGPDAGRVDTSIMNKQLENSVQDLGMELADVFVGKFRNKIVAHIATLMNQHAMSGVRINPRTFMDELKDFDRDGFMEIAEECVSDVVEALEKYAKELGELAVHMAGGNDQGDFDNTMGGRR